MRLVLYYHTAGHKNVHLFCISYSSTCSASVIHPPNASCIILSYSWSLRMTTCSASVIHPPNASRIILSYSWSLRMSTCSASVIHPTNASCIILSYSWSLRMSTFSASVIHPPVLHQLFIHRMRLVLYYHTAGH